MLHYLYEGWVEAGEAVRGFDCVEVKAYRCKMPDGSYRIVLADHKPKMSGNPGHLVSEPAIEPEPEIKAEGTDPE